MLTLNKNFWTGGAAGSVADENTVFLMNFNSTPFVDESSNEYALTSYDDADTAQDTTDTMFSSAGSYEGPSSASDDQALQNIGQGDYIGYFADKTDPFTVELFWRQTATIVGLVVSGGYTGERTWQLSTYRSSSTSAIRWYWYNTSNTVHSLNASPWNDDGTARVSIVSGEWYYVCIRHDGTNQQVFADKASKSTARLIAERTVDSLSGEMDQNDRLVIGALPYSNSNMSDLRYPILGNIDSLRISDIARYTVDTSGSIDSIPMPTAELS